MSPTLPAVSEGGAVHEHNTHFMGDVVGGAEGNLMELENSRDKDQWWEEQNSPGKYLRRHLNGQQGVADFKSSVLIKAEAANGKEK